VSAPAQAIPVTGFGLEVASCDPGGTFIDLRLSDGIASDVAARLHVDFNGRSVRCHNPLGDASLLSCSIPPLTVFPVLVGIRMDDTVITQFSYDRALCVVNVPGQPEATAYPPLILAITPSSTVILPTRTPTRHPGHTPAATWTTEPPPTEPSATEPPVTEPPVTEPPVTEPPPTEPPATQPPPTQPPSTDPPATDPPATEAPTQPEQTQPPRPPTHTARPPRPTDPPGTEEPVPTPAASGWDVQQPAPHLAAIGWQAANRT
jgi:hypothetical protein